MSDRTTSATSREPAAKARAARPRAPRTETESPAITPPDPAGGGFLSRREVSQLFGVSASTVTRWARTGLLNAVRTPGGHYRFPAAETQRAVRTTTSAEPARVDRE